MNKMLALALCLIICLTGAVPAFSIPLPPIQLPPIQLPPPPMPKIEVPAPKIEVPAPKIEVPVPNIEPPKIEPPAINPPAINPPVINPSIGGGGSASGQTTDGAWPANGEIYRNPEHIADELLLNVTIAQSDPGCANYIKIYKDGEFVSGLFIGGTGSAATTLAEGDYSIKVGVGETWLGLDDAFGKDGVYTTMLFSGGSDKAPLEAGGSYTLTIKTTRADPDAESVGARSESWAGF